MVSTCKRRNQQKRQLSQLNETLNDFAIGSKANVGVIGNENLEPQIDGHYNIREEAVDDEISACRNHALRNNIDEKIQKAVDNEVMNVDNLMHDIILTAMDNVVIPRVETAVPSNTAASGHGPASTVQNPDRRDFIGNAENTPLKLASSRLVLKIDRDRIDETRDIENFEDSDFLALKPNNDRQAHTHHRFP